MQYHQLFASLAALLITAASSSCRSGALGSTQEERSYILAPTAVAGAAEPRAPAAAMSPARLEAELMSALPPASRPVQEDEPYPNMYKTFELAMGLAAYDNFDTTMRLSSDVGVGGLLDLEDLLGLDDSQSVFRADAFYSFSPRHRINLGYYDIGRSGSETLVEDVVIGDVTFPAGAGVDSQLDTTIFKLAYQYNFVTDVRTAIGASIGLHTMKIDTEFKTLTGGGFQESFKATAPLPVLGLHAEYALSPKWKLLGSTEFFQIELGSFDGFLADNRLSLEHNLFKHVGWGIGFNSFTLDASVEEDDLTADLEYAFQGLMIYVRGTF